MIGRIILGPFLESKKGDCEKIKTIHHHNFDFKIMELEKPPHLSHKAYEGKLWKFFLFENFYAT